MMILLERQFVNGRDRLESCIRLTAHWVDGWKFKDGKWKYEEEEPLPHVGEGWFRCRVHLYSLPGTNVTREMMQEDVQEIDCLFDISGVSVQFSGKELLVIVPLDLNWSKTDNESKNPMVFRDLESFDLPIGSKAFFGLQILITYRNLNKLFGSKKMFANSLDHGGYRWVGSAPLHS